MLALPSHSLLNLPSWDWGFEDQSGKVKVEISSLPSLLGFSHTVLLFFRNFALKNLKVICHRWLMVSKPLFTSFAKHSSSFFHLPVASPVWTKQRPGKPTHEHQPQGMGETNHSKSRFSLRLNLGDVSH